MRRWEKCLGDFLFAPENDRWLSLLRIGLGLVILVYACDLRADWFRFFASPAEALVSRQLSEVIVSAESPLIPNISWLITGASYLGLEPATTLFAIWLALLCAGLFVFVGYFARAAAITAWLLHLCAAKSGALLSYGVDNFITIGLFYLMLAPLPDRLAFDWRVRATTLAQNQVALRFFRRALQCHLCLIYFFAGLAKALGRGWWNGANIWRALTRPPFDVLSPATIAQWAILLPALGISIWLLELGYAVLIWPRGTRRLCLGLICAMHLAIAFTMGMYLFALVMIVLNVAAFGPAEQTRALAD